MNISRRATYYALTVLSILTSIGTLGARSRQPYLTSVSVSPSYPTIQVGSTQKFTAKGKYSDGSTQDVSNQATWTSSNKYVSSVAYGGVASGVSAGTAKISATYSSFVGSTTLTVQAPPPPAPTPTPTPAPTPSVSTADQIAADMGVNEAHPHGVPLSWDQANGSYVVMGNAPGTNKAAVLWGVIYASAAGNPTTNTRVAIRGCEIWWKQKSTGTWMLGTKGENPQIELYAEDFSSGPNAANVRTESDGSVSVLPVAGQTAHFYPSRLGFLNNDLAGWVSVCQMRLVVNSTSSVDDRAKASLLGETGADYYPALTGPGIANNPGIAGGKFKFIGTDWRSFAMTTLSQSELESNPPPIVFTGVLP